MRGLQFNGFHSIKKLRFGLGLLLSVSLLSFGTFVGVHKASAADCDSNSIIYCGTGSASQFISQVRTNDSKNGHHDLQAIYAHYGLEPAEYDKFVKSSRPGTLYKDGHVVVDGLTVATNTNTIGRNAGSQGNGYFTIGIGGQNYYGNTSGATFAAGTNSIPVMAMFNAQGALEFAVLTACGNPVGFQANPPSYSCNQLQVTPVTGKLNTYRFSTLASAGNGASVAKVQYDLGDGSVQSEINPGTSFEHTYTKAGNFTAKVTVYVNLPGAQQTTVTAGGCQHAISVVLPYYQCLQTLGGLVDKSNKYAYRFTTTVRSGAGATFSKLMYDTGDGQKVSSTAAGGVLTHTYAKPGNYVVKVTAYFTIPDKGEVTATSTGCQYKVAVAQPIYSCDGMNTPVVDKTNKYKYSFTSSATYKDGATLAKYVYNFGDGKTGTATTANGAIDHTYTKAGQYTAKVTVYVNRHGDSQGSVTSAKCQQKFTVVTPFYSCVQLTGDFVDKDKYIVKLVATGDAGNGASLVSGDITYGDGTIVNGVKAVGKTVSMQHTYAGAGNYDALVVLHFTVNGSAANAPACKALISPTAPPTPECKPGIPVGDVRCSPCQYDNSLPSDSPKCVSPLPPVLPDTGAGNVIAIASVVAIGGFLIYRQLLFRGHKAAFLAAERGTSPLPLGQPLDPSAPLAGTPLATKVRKTFRRNRPY